ncbi:MAG: 6-carboxytetrahydropterin synthase [Candidatus Nitrohelix vancouverensis]|uniref:6-carboxy-5,6,7,8-tetrahydropterin synthase n=1 Tax=Candidatus Nitrohelix vancouverensis TaxID=2705534 RepID=A0A7T0C4A3_9BACT|nr:MAG: 6-carboxytetrahydropterin synthase [Candidatus Nitrohelix vancouverensis]
MYDVNIKTQFSAAHQLKYFDGKYENLHGHNWTVFVTVTAKELDAIGLGVDFVELKKWTNECIEKLDYKNLNEVEPFTEMNPSAENIARWIFFSLKTTVNNENVTLKRVEVREFEECGAAYYE